MQPARHDARKHQNAPPTKFFSSLLMVYANVRAFRFGFPLEFWSAVAKAAPTVSSAKYSRPTGLKDLVAATQGRINFVPVDSTVGKFFEISPESTTALWATAGAMGPAPCIALAKALRARDAVRIKTICADIDWSNAPIGHILDNPEIFASYNIQLEKIRIESAGYCKPGPVRPPYDVMPDDYAEACRETGRRWAELCKRYAQQPASTA